MSDRSRVSAHDAAVHFRVNKALREAAEERARRQYMTASEFFRSALHRAVSEAA